MRSRLEDLRDNPERISKYREAITLLYEAGVDQVLLELSLGDHVDGYDAQGLQASAFLHHQGLGYQKCMGDLFDLLSIVDGKERPPVADFGAADRLESQGMIDAEQKEQLLRGE